MSVYVDGEEISWNIPVIIVVVITLSLGYFVHKVIHYDRIVTVDTREYKADRLLDIDDNCVQYMYEGILYNKCGDNIKVESREH